MGDRQCIFLGLPGVGVEAQAAALADRWQVPWVALEALVQGAIAQQTALGIEAFAHVEAGTPLPDDLALRLIRRRLEQPDAMLQGWVLTGFPATVAQAQGLDQWWAAAGQPPARVVYLRAMTELLIGRLATAPGPQRPISAIRDRLEGHLAQLEPLLAYYQPLGRLTTVNGSLPAAEVARELAGLGQEAAGAAEWVRDEAELDALLATEPRLVVDCMASWCGSCKQIAPLIDRLAETYRAQVAVVKSDFDANRQISKRFELKGIPAVMVFKDGQRLATLTGVKSYQDYSAAIAPLLT
jgi:thioredoxin